MSSFLYWVIMQLRLDLNLLPFLPCPGQLRHLMLVTKVSRFELRFELHEHYYPSAIMFGGSTHIFPKTFRQGMSHFESVLQKYFMSSCNALVSGFFISVSEFLFRFIY